MKLTQLSNLFDITYGNGFELNKLELSASSGSGVNFVSRTSKNNGVAAKVRELPNSTPFASGLITVAVSGSVLETFLQPEPFYTAYHVMILTPKGNMTEEEKLFYCACIRRNKYRYSYGRQANKTLKKIEVPSIAPKWISRINAKSIKGISNSVNQKSIKLNVEKWKSFKYSDLFDIDRGRGPRLKDLQDFGAHPFVTAIDNNNGWSGWTDETPKHKSNVISVARNGNGVAESFYQPKEFCSTEDVHVFNPKFQLNPYIALFLTTLIRKEKYRYNYGRKWGLKRMNDSEIKLPEKNGLPDFELMENYIKSLPYSASV